MNFIELEKLMNANGVKSLAEIARVLETTPQAVSNWKARGQIPFHIVDKINKDIKSNSDKINNKQEIQLKRAISLSDILLILAKQLKLIVIVPFVLFFLTFTYVMFFEVPQYVSSSTVLFPDKQSSSNMGGISNIASQFGLNLQGGSLASGIDLSSPSLFPEIIRSRTFASRILKTEFYSIKYGKKLTLLSILNDGVFIPEANIESEITGVMPKLELMITLETSLKSAFSIIYVNASEAQLSKELNDVILLELEALNRLFKKQSVSEKNRFIQNRISYVEKDLEESEIRLKSFNEKNRQISSPSLQLDLDRFEREVETQKSVFLTLKQQLELAKIEEVEEISILQVLDPPQVPVGPFNKNWKKSSILSIIFGLGLGVMLSFFRAYINNPNISERKKLRRVKSFLKKKFKGLILDRRVTGTVSLLLLIGLPVYITHESTNPVYFGLYSAKFLLINIVYILLLLISALTFIYSTVKKNSK